MQNEIIQMVAPIITMLVTTVGIVWKISRSGNEIKELLHALDKRIQKLEIETDQVKQDHDNLVVLGLRVSKAEQDINQGFSGLRSKLNDIRSALHGRK